MSAEADLLVERAATGVETLRLNRPHAYNALSRELVDGLRREVGRLAGSDARVVVLAAANPGFCSGADLKQRRAMDDAAKFAHNRAISALADEVAALPMPTIVAINGVAMGGGCELALACDLRIAARGARIGLTEARIGAIPGAGGTQRLPRTIGVSRALELMFTGEPIDASEAVRIGLVNRMVPDGELAEAVASLAATIASRSPRATRLLKRVAREGAEMPLSAGLELEGSVIPGVLASDDYREGLAAFAERRPPKFA